MHGRRKGLPHCCDAWLRPSEEQGLPASPSSPARLSLAGPSCSAALQGRPVFAFSTMSPHTADIKKDGRCSFTVMAEPFRVRRRPSPA